MNIIREKDTLADGRARELIPTRIKETVERMRSRLRQQEADLTFIENLLALAKDSR